MIVGTLLATTAIGPGCSREGLQLAANIFWLAASAVELVSAVASLSHASQHYHYGNCGHQRAVYDGRQVFYANDQWEYYDDYNDTWYVYPDGLPGY